MAKDKMLNGIGWYGFIGPTTSTTDISLGSHRLEKYLNIKDCVEKSFITKFALKITLDTLKGLEKSLNFTIYRRIQYCFWRPKSV